MKGIYLLIEPILLFSEMVDSILKENDLNKDGYLSYGEYVRARRHS